MNNVNTEREYYLAFSLINGIGPKTFALLLGYFKTAGKAWTAGSKELKIAGLNDKLIQKLETAKQEFKVKDYLEKLKQKKASFIASCDKEYPKLLKEIPNPPIVLYFKGDINIIQNINAGLAKVANENFFGPAVRLPSGKNFISSPQANPPIGIVGTRKITNYGREVTELFSSNLVSMGFTIVSGLAMGVDAQAAWSAINSGGKTIAVLGNGVDLCFPSSNEKLYDKILDNNGIIVSEFPLGQSPTMGSFPSRNRIIAGLSLGVLVTEGAKDSGSLITADYAFKFGRKVFAIPGPITSSLSVAPLKLIEKGAILVTSADDILKQLDIKSLSSKALGVAEKLDRAGKIVKLSKEEGKIIKMLENEPLLLDEIIRALNISASSGAIILSFLEVKGLVKQESGGYYKLL